MRVGIVCPYSLTLPGGVQGQVVGLAHALRNIGVDARVLGPCDGPPPDASVTPLGDSVPLASNGSFAPIAPDFPCALRTIRALRDEAFDVVHLHEPLVPGPTLTALVFTDAPLIGTFHRAGESAIYRAMRPLARWAAARLSVRCAVSEDALATASEALGGSYELVFNGIELGRFAKAVPWPTEGPTILFVGRHEPRKGLAVLLDAMQYLGPDVRLWVASDGPQMAKLQSRSASDPRIEWLGRINEEEKARRLRAADVFCAPSLDGESFGVVLLEAMAASAAIVASDLPGYRNVARPGKDAVLIPPGDAVALAQAVSRVLEDSRLREQLVASGECRAAGFSMDHLAERYVELYERMVSDRREMGRVARRQG
ncbi:MAG TPA: glycosyltransferase family 4 protein [Acidimicrobiales bacterium]|nr:glycosyltransferase family 4 protein [Acidimicrobiales bacterium]